MSEFQGNNLIQNVTQHFYCRAFATFQENIHFLLHVMSLNRHTHSDTDTDGHLEWALYTQAHNARQTDVGWTKMLKHQGNQAGA